MAPPFVVRKEFTLASKSEPLPVNECRALELLPIDIELAPKAFDLQPLHLSHERP